jgi:hypothetical protein
MSQPSQVVQARGRFRMFWPELLLTDGERTLV